MNGLSEEIFESDYEGGFEGEEEYADQEAGDYESESEWGYQGEGEAGFGDGEGPFSEEQEIELAAELLSLSQDQELDQFLGNLIRRAGKAAGKIVRSPIGQALGGLLRQAAKKALPVVGGAVGSYFGGPAGKAIGSKLATAGGQIFGLEVEGMSGEDQEFQVARRFVRLAGEAATQAAQTPADASPQQAARKALATAARKHAPGLLRSGNGAASGTGTGTGAQRRRSGRWIRHGNKIVLIGV
jgi:uncharacterized protein (DUF697 family)